VVFPDTSPRDTGIEGIKDDPYFGEGAGFYLNATEEKYKKHFNMYSYVTEELPWIVQQHFHVSDKIQSITGSSMGGLGALNLFLKNPGKYKSVSAFAPISHPTSEGLWGPLAFQKYLGSVEKGREYDPTILVS